MNPQEEDLAAWFSGRLPDDWFEGAPEIRIDREEILVVGRLPQPHAADAGAPNAKQAAVGRIQRFREQTRPDRIRIAREAEHRFGRKVSWGARCGSETLLFAHLSVPVMTRLRIAERTVLDTLVEAGVARSRSDALGWCVRLVGRHNKEWIDELKEALVHVEGVRRKGPNS